MKKYILNEHVRLRESVMLIEEIEVFDCNEDAIRMINAMEECMQIKGAFSKEDLLESLALENTPDNVFSISNVINYLKGCFIINEFIETT